MNIDAVDLLFEEQVHRLVKLRPCIHHTGAHGVGKFAESGEHLRFGKFHALLVGTVGSTGAGLAEAVVAEQEYAYFRSALGIHGSPRQRASS